MQDLKVKVFFKEAQLSFDKDYTYILPASLQADYPAVRDFVGFRVQCPVGTKNRLVEAFILEQCLEQEEDNLDALELKKIDHFCDPFPLLEKEELTWLLNLSKYYDVSRGKIAKLMVPSYLKWSKKKQKQLQQGELSSAIYSEEKIQANYKVLTPAQEAVFQSLNHAFIHEKKAEYLLFGVTGSGKTEIYIHLIASCLAQDKTALLLLPEIALTPMMVERFSKYFDGKMAVIHSQLTAKEKQETWLKIKQGEIKLLLGARSALFSPLKNLGLIIIDEEHEPTYFSQKSPYYDTRDVARLRLLNEGFLLLGSATPSVQTMHRVEQGKCLLIHLKERALVQQFPHIIFSKPSTLKGETADALISSRLSSGLQNCFAKGSKAIILCNKRGFGRHLICKQCGQGLSCPNCSVHLVYHKKKKAFICHHCSHQMSLDAGKHCLSCGGETFEAQSYAIEAYEQALKTIFPERPILRMDLDQISGEESHESLLKKFKEEEYDILIGTQMVAKGHDFPQVAFVGVLGIDSLLNLPHYQAAERTFQLLTQAAGRAGRSVYSQESEVYIETSQSEHYAVAFALLQDTESFLKEEMYRRKLYGLPPYKHQLTVLISGKNQEKTEQAIEHLHQVIHKKLLQYFNFASVQKIQMTPIFPAEVHKVNKSYRYMFLLSTEDRKSLLRLRAYLHRIQLKTGLELMVKLDPA